MSISSLFALVVGMFIIYNSFSIAIGQRRAEIGILRALGATRRQVRRLFLLESVIAGLVGSALGIVVGIGMAVGVSRYMGDLTQQVVGVAQQVDSLAIEPWLMGAALAVGLVTSVIAAWIPARNAARVDPIQALQKGKYQVLSAGENRRRRIAALVLVVVSGVLLMISDRKPAFYAGYIFVMLSGLLMTPTLSLLLAKALRPVLKRILPAEGTLAADSLIQSPRRTSATVSALMLSLAMVVGFGGFTDSIYDSMNEWMTTALNPDFFVAGSPNLTNRSMTFPAEVGGDIESVEGVDQVQLVRDARVLYRNTPVMVVSVEAAKLITKVKRKAIAGDINRMHELTAAGKGMIISDGFSSMQHVGVSDVVEIPTPSGILKLPVTGIVRDYSDLQGAVFIDRSLYVQYWKDASVNIARVYVTRGVDPAKVRERILQRLSGRYRLLVLGNNEVRAYVLRLIDQWFGMTYNQIAVAVLVAVLGIVNTLTVSITDRRRELGVMQAVGGLRKQIRRTVWLEAISIGVIGLVLGSGLGAINLYYNLGMVKRDLGGLDLDYIYPVGFIAVMIPTILLAAFVASVGPAESAVRGGLVEALEYE
jgi:putative ABC transport system permease protein